MRASLLLLAAVFVPVASWAADSEGSVVYLRDGGAFLVERFDAAGDRVNVSLPATIVGCSIPAVAIDRIEPWAGGAIASAYPVVAVPGPWCFYSFQDRGFAPNIMGAGSLALVKALLASAPTDAELQRMAASYAGKAVVGQLFAWTGVAVAIGSFVYLGWDYTPLPPNPTEEQEGQLMLRDFGFIGLFFGGLIVWDIGGKLAGEPREIVNYYNEVYREQR